MGLYRSARGHGCWLVGPSHRHRSRYRPASGSPPNVEGVLMVLIRHNIDDLLRTAAARQAPRRTMNTWRDGPRTPSVAQQLPQSASLESFNVQTPRSRHTPARRVQHPCHTSSHRHLHTDDMTVVGPTFEVGTRRVVHLEQTFTGCQHVSVLYQSISW